MMLKPGSYLQNRYEILSLIGTGGMSEVYQAKCHRLNRLVAIKVLKEEYSSDKNFISRFKMEAQSAASLSHPNIVSIYDVENEGNLHYIVMELIEGITLKSYIQNKGRLGVKEIIGIAIQVAQGIGAAHDQHIVHRDIKPQNMIISRDGKVKVADFGIARLITEQTKGSNAIGSVHYISPEQARGENSDARSDIYSLGITMFEMCTGEVPFTGDSSVAIALAHVEQQVIPPSRLNPEIPASLDRIVRKCTMKKPEERYQDAYELIADLRHALIDPDDIQYKKEPENIESAPTQKREKGEIDIIVQREKDERDRRREIIHEKKPEPSKTGKGSENVDHQLDWLLSAIGVIAACIIVIVIAVMALRLTGVFNLFSDSRPQTTEAAAPSTEESTAPRAVLVESDTPAPEETETESTEAPTEPPMVDLAVYNLPGLGSEEAQNIVASLGLTCSLEEVYNETVESGRVISVSPESAEPGSEVKLTVSKGPEIEMVPVPLITGMSEDNARVVLETIGLKLGNKTEVSNREVAAGTIMNQSVADNTQVPKGTAVNYTVSLGSNTEYRAAIDDVLVLQDMFGPSARSTELKISIVAKQVVNGENSTQVIMEPRTVQGDTSLPLHYTIHGAFGVETGELQVLDLTNDKILKTYELQFIEVDK